MPCFHREFLQSKGFRRGHERTARAMRRRDLLPPRSHPCSHRSPDRSRASASPVRSAARLEGPDTRNAARPKMRLRLTPYPTGLESPMANPNRARGHKPRVGDSSPSSGTASALNGSSAPRPRRPPMAQRPIAAERPTDRAPRQARRPRELLDRRATNEVLAPQFSPVLHSNHPFRLPVARSDEAQHHPDDSASHPRGAVFTRRRQPERRVGRQYQGT
jgi:hypothetical protein